MSWSHQRTTVTSTATLIRQNVGDTQELVIVVNRGGASIFVGNDDTVTTGNGFEIAAGESWPIKLHPSDTLYGIAVGSEVVHCSIED